MDINPQVNKFSKFPQEFQCESERGATIFAGNALDEKFKNTCVDLLSRV